MKEGQIVALTRCKVYGSGPETFPVSGLWELVERDQQDLSAGLRGTYWALVPEGTADTDGWEGRMVWAEETDLLQQVEPAEYGKIIRQEREMELAEA